MVSEGDEADQDGEGGHVGKRDEENKIKYLIFITMMKINKVIDPKKL